MCDTCKALSIVPIILYMPQQIMAIIMFKTLQFQVEYMTTVFLGLV